MSYADRRDVDFAGLVVFLRAVGCDVSRFLASAVGCCLVFFACSTEAFSAAIKSTTLPPPSCGARKSESGVDLRIPDGVVRRGQAAIWYSHRVTSAG